MNKIWKVVSAALPALIALTLASAAWAQTPKSPSDSRGEQFYIISSVDMQKHQMVLMLPTQLTVVANADDNSVFLGEQGQKLALKDLHAGQTVWATLRKDKSGQTSIARLREGAMSIAQLHKLYLDYPSQTKSQ
jgi:hypothetical protein